MKWKTWAALVLLGALVGIWMYRYLQQNQDAIPSPLRESDRPVEDESIARAS